MNNQPWRFAVVQNAAHLKRYSDAAKEMLLAQQSTDHKIRGYADMLRAPDFNIFYNAGTLIVICVEEKAPYVEADVWLAAENLMLAACAEGLGTCCIGFAVGVLNTAVLKEELGIPAQGMAIAPIIVGYPRAVPAAVPRKDARVLSWRR
jgi:nitroreductase